VPGQKADRPNAILSPVLVVVTDEILDGGKRAPCGRMRRSGSAPYAIRDARSQLNLLPPRRILGPRLSVTS